MRRLPVAVAAVVLAATASAAVDGRTHAGRAVPGVGMIRLGDSAPLGAAHFASSSYVILSPHERRYAISARKADPSIVTLAYKTAAGLDRSPECGRGVDTCASAISLAETNEHDAHAPPSDRWALRDDSGNPMIAQDYAQFALGDVGVPSFQQRWIDNVSRFLRANHFSGVFIDAVGGELSGSTGGRFTSKYPNDQAWERAMTAFIKRVGPALRKRGFFVAANAWKEFPRTIAWWQEIASSTDALMVEFWQQNPNDLGQLYTSDAASWTGRWNYWESLVDIAQRAGTAFFGLQEGDPTDIRMMRYGRASFLLAWNGKGGAYFFNPRAAVDPWQQAWTTDVGRPVGSRYRVGVGWRRAFKQGTVIVNPTVSQPQTFDLGGRYVLPGGKTARVVTLQPTTALILRRASSS